MEETARGRAGSPQSIRAEQRRIKVGQPIARIVVHLQNTTHKVRAVQTPVVHAIRQTPLQGAVAIARNSDRKTGAGASDSGDRPSSREDSGPAGQAFEGELIVIGRY